MRTNFLSVFSPRLSLEMKVIYSRKKQFCLSQIFIGFLITGVLRKSGKTEEKCHLINEQSVFPLTYTSNESVRPPLLIDYDIRTLGVFETPAFWRNHSAVIIQKSMPNKRKNWETQSLFYLCDLKSVPDIGICLVFVLL